MKKSPLATTSSTIKILKKICDLLFYQIKIVVVGKSTKMKENNNKSKDIDYCIEFTCVFI